MTIPPPPTQLWILVIAALVAVLVIDVVVWYLAVPEMMLP